jgi:hypothetical protein
MDDDLRVEAEGVANMWNGKPLWSAGYPKGNSINTDLWETKFESNLMFLVQQPKVSEWSYFY